MTIALYKVPTVYVHDTRGAEPQKYPTVAGVIQGCNAGMTAYCISQRKPIEWIAKTAEAAGRGHPDLPAFENQLSTAVKERWQKWLSAHRLSQPTPESSVVVH